MQRKREVGHDIHLFLFLVEEDFRKEHPEWAGRIGQWILLWEVAARPESLQGEQPFNEQCRRELLDAMATDCDFTLAFLAFARERLHNDRTGKSAVQRELLLNPEMRPLQDKEIAAKLNISSRTVEYHKYQMMKDLGLTTAAELIRYAVRHHIISE